MRASIVIATYQHAAQLPEAINSALAQTVPCEVIVVDDGSTDGTAAVLAGYGARIRVITLPHGGPCLARNAGIDAALGEFVMLLDADDLIAPTKIEAQLAEFARQPEAGWVLCDVRIEDVGRREVVNASVRYDYASKSLGGWIQPLLTAGNFIPIMSPLVRRSVLTDNGIRFQDERVPEDWHFWHAVAGAARVRYVPQVLATYRKSRTGRSRTPKAARLVSPTIVQPLRLNLGCGTQGTRSWHPIAGMVNLDKSMGWRFEDGLGEFVDGSVAGITISHASMYMPLEKWPAFFSEVARVLSPGGVIRITEDDCGNPLSRTYLNGWQGSDPAITLTDPEMVAAHMKRAGLTAQRCDATQTHYRDNSLLQDQHGGAPHCFYVEGIKVRAVLFTPHHDDEVLFGAFVVLKFRPRIVVCHESTGDYGSTDARFAESMDAVTVLGGESVEQWNGGDLAERMREYDAKHRPSLVFAPHEQASHPDHLAVALAARAVFGDRLRTYHTYDENGKVRSEWPVEFEPAWVHAKLRALSRYESQATHSRAHQFFLFDQREYWGEQPTIAAASRT